MGAKAVYRRQQLRASLAKITGMLRIALPLLFLSSTLLPAQQYRPYVATLRDVSGPSGPQAKVITTRIEAQDSKGNRYTKDVGAAKGDTRITLITTSGLYVEALENVRIMTSIQRTPAEHAERNSGRPVPAKDCVDHFANIPGPPGTGLSIAGREQLAGVGVVKLVQPASPSARMVVWRAPSLNGVTLRREMVFAGSASQGGSTRLELVTLSLSEDASLFQPPKFREVPPSEFHTAVARFFGGEPNENMKQRFAQMDKSYHEHRSRK
ncbi:MAG: hypothetical protein ABI972_22475 [Acidobacteriota bacterium]